MLIVYADFWGHKCTFYHEGKECILATLKDCRLFAAKHGYSGIKVEKVKK